MLNTKDIRSRLLRWFQREGMDYPWRRTTDPYAVLVSEMMLQQTRIQTVLDRGYFVRWMERFPDVATLASASESEVLRLWEGLGYYRRARNLWRTARLLLERHDGLFPRTPGALAALPGVGRYTAAAVAAFAFNHPTALVDGNVARVVARLANFRDRVDSAEGQRFLWDTAAALLAPRRAREFNSAIMELGQRICTPRAPACTRCPVRLGCLGREMNPAAIPAKRPRSALIDVDEWAVWAVRDHHILLAHEDGGRRRGLWRLPGRPEPEVRALALLLEIEYPITNHRVRLRVHRAPEGLEAAHGEQWIPFPSLPGLPMGAPYRKVICALGPAEGGTVPPPAR